MDRRLLAATGAAALVAAAFLGLDTNTDIGAVELRPEEAASVPDPATSAVPTAGPETASDVAIGAPTASATPTEADAGSGRPVTPTATSRQQASAPRSTPAAEVTSRPAPTPVVDVATRPARLADLEAAAAPAPVRLTIESIDVDVPVTALGVDTKGQMAIPEDVDEAGWYRFGPAPGAPGNAVIAGHVDSRTQGLGAFHALVDVDVGDLVTVESADGSTSDFRVTGRREVAKDALATDDLFRRDGPSQLVLVTCGGDFDADAGSYRSNVVVVAQPV